MAIILVTDSNGRKYELQVPGDGPVLTTALLEPVLAPHHLAIGNIVTINTDLTHQGLPGRIQVIPSGGGQAAPADDEAVSQTEPDSSPMDRHRHGVRRTMATISLIVASGGLADIGFFIQWLATRRRSLPRSFGLNKPTTRRLEHYREKNRIALKTNQNRHIFIDVPPRMDSIGATWLRKQLRAKRVDRESIVSLILPERVTSIGGATFEGCTALTTLNLPAMTSIGPIAFRDCTTLTTLNLPAVTSIGPSAFRRCTTLTTLNLPAVTSIGGTAFEGCSTLTALNLSEVTSIGWNTFGHCTALTDLNLPAVTSIGETAFEGCTALTTFNLPAVTSIGLSAFGRCTALTSLNLPAVTSIGEAAFEGCTALTDLNLPAATSIARTAFRSCTALTTLSLPAATSIGRGALYYCIALTTLNLPAVTSIMLAAFRHCTNLRYLSVPTGLVINRTQIGLNDATQVIRIDPQLVSAPLPVKLNEISKLYFHLLQINQITDPQIQLELQQALRRIYFNKATDVGGLYEQIATLIQLKKIRGPDNTAKNADLLINLRLYLSQQYDSLFTEPTVRESLPKAKHFCTAISKATTTNLPNGLILQVLLYNNSSTAVLLGGGRLSIFSAEMRSRTQQPATAVTPN